jgi:hypothetical protein
MPDREWRGGWKNAKKYPEIPARMALLPNPRRGTSLYLETVCTNARGVYCSNPTSIPNLLAIRTAEHLAKRMKWSFSQAHKMMMILGQVFQDSLLKGEPCGIPFVGALYVDRRSHLRSPANSTAIDFSNVTFARIRFFQPKKWDHFYAQRCPCTGTMRDWAKDARSIAERHVKKAKRPYVWRRRSGVYGSDTRFPKVVRRGSEPAIDCV